MDLAELSIPSANPHVVNAHPVAIDATTQPRVRRFGSTARWALTIAATAASTLALEAVAAAAGVLLAESHVLDGAHRSVVLGFLAATYVVWAAGLRVNLKANWRLLDETGTSTNALSKMGFELARLRSCSPRAVRAASAVGYVVTEIAKEAPYYAGAFGTALVSSSVDAKDALIFLGGANLGAAVYEYGVARLVRGVLDTRSLRIVRPRPSKSAEPYASFDTDWRPHEYLNDYYRVVEPDEQATIAFFVDALRDAEPDQPVLLFGVGPTLHHVFLAAEQAIEIHLAEYLPTNLREIERWLAGAADAHDWSPFVTYTLACEGVAHPTADEIRDREDVTRAKITALLAGDARCADPLEGKGAAPYGTVISAYCADSATADTTTWETYMRHIAGLVEPGGLFITAALRRCSGYVVGGKVFPSACVDEEDLRRVLERDFDWDDGVIEVCDLSADRMATQASSWHAYAESRSRWRRGPTNAMQMSGSTTSACPV